MKYLSPMFADLRDNWWNMIKDGIMDLIWPIPGVLGDITSSFSNLLSALDHLWSFEFQEFIDSLVSVWGNVNAALGRLSGWISVVLIAGSTAVGAFVGGPVGAAAGFSAGMSSAVSVGMGIITSTIGQMVTQLLTSIGSLKTIEEAQNDHEIALHNEEHYAKIAGNGFGIGVMATMTAKLRSKNRVLPFQNMK